MACSDTGERGYEAVLTMDGVEVSRARDVSVTFTYKEMDATTRSSGGWDEYMAGRGKMTFTSDAMWVPNNEAFQRVEQAAREREVITFKIVDSYGEGWDGCCIITRFEQSPANLDDVIGLSFDATCSGYPRKICGNASGGSVACGSTYGSWGSGQGS